MKTLTSHEYADRLAALANFLKTKPVFQTDSYKIYAWFHYGQRATFLEAVKSVGTGKKMFTDEEIKFYPTISEGVQCELKAPRNLVCRLVKEAEYECEPLLSQAEIASL